MKTREELKQVAMANLITVLLIAVVIMSVELVHKTKQVNGATEAGFQTCQQQF